MDYEDSECDDAWDEDGGDLDGGSDVGEDELDLRIDAADYDDAEGRLLIAIQNSLGWANGPAVAEAARRVLEIGLQLGQRQAVGLDFSALNVIDVKDLLIASWSEYCQPEAESRGSIESAAMATDIHEMFMTLIDVIVTSHQTIIAHKYADTTLQTDVQFQAAEQAGVTYDAATDAFAHVLRFLDRSISRVRRVHRRQREREADDGRATRRGRMNGSNVDGQW
jgi:hypothetical protein